MPLHPHLLDHLRAANHAPSPETLRRLGEAGTATGLSDVLAADIEAYDATPEGKAWTEAAKGAGLERVTNLEVRAKFERAFDEFATLFDRIGFTMLTPGECVMANPEIFTHWSGVCERMQDNDLEPEVTITPLANVSQLKALYQNLQNDTKVNHDERIKNGGLFINDNVAKNWDHLTEQTILAADTVVTTADGTKWIIQVNPGTVEAPNAGAPQTDTDIPIAPHVYLAAQARKLQNNQQPLDEAGWSWLHGTFDAGARAPRGFWRRDDGQVRVNWDGVGIRYVNLGSRSPVG